MVKKVLIDKANRLYQMPPEILAFVNTERRRVSFKKEDILDLATFRWPIDFESDQIPDGAGLAAAPEKRLGELKEELADWLSERYQVKLAPDKEIFVGGSITSMVHQLTMAYVDVGDVAFVPGLAIPLYRSAVTACDGEPIGYQISAKSDWRPQFDRLSTGLGRVARLLFLNSPHNPTGTELTDSDLAELTWLAGKENILLVNDAAYAGLPHRPPASLLSVKGSRRVGVELYSFAYLLGLPPLPFGFAVGNRELISGLKRMARHVPAHIPNFYVDLAREELRRFPGQALKQVRDRVRSAAAAADRLAGTLKLETAGHPGAPYAWVRLERRTPSTTLARSLLRRYNIVAAPGASFGESGEGYLRFCLMAGGDAFDTAVKRVEKRRILKARSKT